VRDGRLADVERASGGRLPSDPTALIAALGGDPGELASLAVPDDAPAVQGARLGPPVPRPSKILAAALNYHSHAAETGQEAPDQPVFFTKLPSALGGPEDDIVIPESRDTVDWEAELVVVVGRRAKAIAAADAWSYVFGLTGGQDISDRREQGRAIRQFTMAKSFDTYAPTGPVLATVDEFPDPDDVGLRCVLDGEEVQNGRTDDLIFSVGRLLEWASNVCTLEPGDLVFTGTPPGVGIGRQPNRFLAPGSVLETEVEHVGAMRNRIVAGAPYRN
jgi:2-keto-4-pentenoate hydratase/2-oxohepta-3-ene-1,7-dioic acid hydratase in catechol pathway